MANKCNVVNTANYDELKKLLPVIRTLMGLTTPLVLSRSGKDRELINKQIREETKRLGIGDYNFRIISVVDKPISEVLNNIEFEIDIFVDSCFEQKTTGTSVFKSDFVTLRRATLCDKCDTLSHDTSYPISKEYAEHIRENNQEERPDIEVSCTDNKIEVFTYQRCLIC